MLKVGHVVISGTGGTAINRGLLLHRRAHLISDSLTVSLLALIPCDLAANDPAVSKDFTFNAIRLFLLADILDDHSIVSELALFVVDKDNRIQILRALCPLEQAFPDDLHYVDFDGEDHSAALLVLLAHVYFSLFGVSLWTTAARIF